MSLERVLQASYGRRLAIGDDNSQYTLSYDTATKSLVLTVLTPRANQSHSCISIANLISLVIDLVDW